MTIEAFPPGLLLILGASLLPLLRGRAREAITLLLPAGSQATKFAVDPPLTT